MAREIEETGGPMAWRNVSSFVSCEFDPRLSDADIIHSIANHTRQGAPTVVESNDSGRPGIEVIAFN